MRVDESLLGRLHRSLCAALLNGNLDRYSTLLIYDMTEHEIIEHDVLVIGAGGAGLRASIEASGSGAKVGLVCKSLLGKAQFIGG